MKSGGFQLWSAYEGGEAVGLIALRPPLHISLLFVDTEHHGRGIARRLLDTALNDLSFATDVHKKVTVHSSPYAVEIYKHLGFVPAATEQIVNGLRFRPMERSEELQLYRLLDEGQAAIRKDRKRPLDEMIADIRGELAKGAVKD